MKQFKGTPAPWQIMKYAATAVESTETQRFIATAGSYSDGTEASDVENQCNAHLIAAAPELLEALQNLVKWESGTVNHVQAYKDAIAAINKALNIQP